MTSVAVCIPSIPPRTEQLARALSSVVNQVRPPDQIIVCVDHDRAGAGATRNRTWKSADTEWVAFLDDDDELHSDHLSSLLEHAAAHPEAGVIFPWYRILRYGEDVGALHAPPSYDGAINTLVYSEPSYLPINVLIKRELLVATGGFKGGRGEDHRLWCELIDMGIKFSHVPKVTWSWHHWGWGLPGTPGNTSGLPERW